MTRFLLRLALAYLAERLVERRGVVTVTLEGMPYETEVFYPDSSEAVVRRMARGEYPGWRVRAEGTTLHWVEEEGVLRGEASVLARMPSGEEVTE